MHHKILSYWRLMRFDRPIGILLLLWPTLWSLCIAAHGIPDLKILIIFILGVVIMRAAGCVINDYADRKFDPYVKRTKMRPLATGEISTNEALVLFGVLTMLALILLLFLNKFAILIALVGGGLTVIYPFTKRWFALPQMVLGFTFAWSVPMVFAAQTNGLPAITGLIYLAAFFWIFAFDTQYAMVDCDDDVHIGIHSSALFFGKKVREWIALSQFLMLVMLILMGVMLKFAYPYYVLLLIASGLIIYQNCLIYSQQREKCLRAFSKNNGLGAIIFAAIVAGVFLK